jgi:demethylmenaquinone methyltransferase/2-methoxy-6-polyprenyl-1,4-benzoquinol methylase
VAFETSHVEVERRYLDSVIRPGTRVIDAGCGRRTRLAAYKDCISELVGVDVDEEGGLENAALDRFVVADLCDSLPLGSEAFDLVYANFVIEHLASPTVAFAEWRRVLRTGGSLVIATSNRASPLLAVASLLPDRARVAAKRRGAGVVERDVFPALYRANTPGRLTSLLADAGFEAVDVSYVATLHRYAEKLRPIDGVLRASERVLPERVRSTIVGWYRAA